MAGHNKWTQIKTRKGVVDKKRAVNFSKVLKLVSIAARTDPNPQFNPRLRSMIDKARELKVPNENIERAIRGASEEKNLEEIRIEAHGPGGIMIIIEGVTDNRNRTIAEVRTILEERGAKMAGQGGAAWAFTMERVDGETKWKPKFPQALEAAPAEKLQILVAALETHDDVEQVATNVI